MVSRQRKTFGQTYLSFLLLLSLINYITGFRMYTIYTRFMWLLHLKTTIRKTQYTYEEINISKDENAKAFKRERYKTVPQIFTMEQNILCLRKD